MMVNDAREGAVIPPLLAFGGGTGDEIGSNAFSFLGGRYFYKTFI